MVIILVLPPGVVSIKLCPPNAWHSRWRCRYPLSGLGESRQCSSWGRPVDVAWSAWCHSHKSLFRLNIPTLTCSLLTGQPVYATGWVPSRLSRGNLRQLGGVRQHFWFMVLTLFGIPSPKTCSRVHFVYQLIIESFQLFLDVIVIP